MSIVSSRTSIALVCLGLGLVGMSLLAGRPRRRKTAVPRPPAGPSEAERVLREVMPDPAEQITG
ncbi:MAG TPA: hypothetical protein VIM86_02495 [Thermodesulfobacteriota bacterium]